MSFIKTVLKVVAVIVLVPIALGLIYGIYNIVTETPEDKKARVERYNEQQLVQKESELNQDQKLKPAPKSDNVLDRNSSEYDVIDSAIRENECKELIAHAYQRLNSIKESYKIESSQNTEMIKLYRANGDLATANKYLDNNHELTQNMGVDSSFQMKRIQKCVDDEISLKGYKVK